MTETDEKSAQMRALLDQPVLARLGTARDGQPHVVPVWFLWDGESLWISAFRSTRKVKDLLRNPLCAVLIEPKDVLPGGLEAVLFEGRAELISAPDPRVAAMAERIYTRYMGEEGVKAAEPQSWIVDAENTLIRLAPQRTLTW